MCAAVVLNAPVPQDGCNIAVKVCGGILFPPYGLYQLGDLAFSALTYKGPLLYQYVNNSQYKTALQYVKDSNGAVCDQAFMTVRGWNVVHLIFEVDPNVEADALPLLDEIVKARKDEFRAMAPFEYTLSRGQNRHFVHLVEKHRDCLTDEISTRLLHLMLRKEVANNICQPLLDHLHHIERLSLLAQGGEDSPYVIAATKSDLRFFRLINETIKGPSLTDEVYKKLLDLMVRGKVAEEVNQPVIRLLREADKTRLLAEGGENSPLVTTVRKGKVDLFRLFIRVIDSRPFRSNENRTILHEMARYNSDGCLRAMRAEKAQEVTDLLDMQDNQGKTATYEAADYNNPEVVGSLISFGADFMIPVREGEKKIIPYNVAPSCCCKDNRARNRLKEAYYGFFNPDPEFVKTGANVIQTRRVNGLFRCCRDGLGLSALQLINTYHLNPDTEFAEGNTALFVLLKSKAQEYEILRFLQGAETRINSNHENANHQTALMVAYARGFFEIANYMWNSYGHILHRDWLGRNVENVEMESLSGSSSPEMRSPTQLIDSIPQTVGGGVLFKPKAIHESGAGMKAVELLERQVSSPAGRQPHEQRGQEGPLAERS